jgi:hypothetical protein
MQDMHMTYKTYQARLDRPVAFASSARHPWDLYRFRTVSRAFATLVSGLEPVCPHLASRPSLLILLYTPCKDPGSVGETESPVVFKVRVCLQFC